MSCKHRSSSVLKRFFSFTPSPFCTPCLEEDKRINKLKDIIMNSILNMDTATQETVGRSLHVHGAIAVPGVGEVSAGVKRTAKDEINFETKKSK